jgi:acetyl-CoA carboxylase carboxyl transferase subunit beta
LPSKTPAQPLDGEKRTLGKGIFRKCSSCGEVLTAEILSKNWEVCPHCGHHHVMSVDGWRRLLLDDGHLDRWEEHVSPTDPLGFFDGEHYTTRLERSQQKTRRTEAIEVGRGRLEGRPVAYGCFIFSFMGGSMGSVVGERITRLFERATEERLPVLLLHASGGARMQEGILSLMQMVKTCAALGRYRRVRQPFVSVLLHPTTGGVAASTALIGDLNVAEPGALIGFAGPRVIENTLRAKLPPGFQRSEFLVDHGMVDVIVPRGEMKDTLATLLGHLSGPAAALHSGTVQGGASKGRARDEFGVRSAPEATEPRAIGPHEVKSNGRNGTAPLNGAASQAARAVVASLADLGDVPKSRRGRS